jgi:hypothetical protein
MGTFSNFESAVLVGVRYLAEGTLKDCVDEALQDSKQFLDRTKQDLERWTGLLAKGDLNKEEFQFLVRGRADLAEMHLLTQAGLSQARLERFRSGLVKLVVDAAIDVLL